MDLEANIMIVQAIWSVQKTTVGTFQSSGIQMQSRDIRSEIVGALARLASLPYQVRYVVNADADCYVIPEELLEDVDGAIRRIRSGHFASFSVEQIQRLDSVFELIQASSGDALDFSASMDASEKILRSDVWRDLRLKSSEALSAFGHDVEALSVNDVDML